MLFSVRELYFISEIGFGCLSRGSPSPCLMTVIFFNLRFLALVSFSLCLVVIVLSALP